MIHNSLLALILFFVFSTHGQAQTQKREFRGVWVATVANIDWPSRAGLPVENQKAEFIKILESHKANGMNAVIFQVRPCADAFYDSPYEPQSRWLTGKLGKYAHPFYDPLEFAVNEAHSRGMELHAWFNPYRAYINYDSTKVDSASLVYQHPEWFLQYGNNLYFDPGLPQAREHTTKVVLDVVKRYDVDAVHFDDYFYPYRIANVEFPDSASFKKFGAGFSNRDDWRRNNVNHLVQTLSDSIKRIKPYVQLGISPFGVWRNKSKDELGSDTRAGQTCYDDLFADVLFWLKQGWIDYVIPQLYWNIGHKAAPYEVLAEWWSKNNYGKSLYIGHGAYRAGNAKDSIWKSADPIDKQLTLNRNYTNIAGSTYFSSKSLINNNGGVATLLRHRYYFKPAFTPLVFSSATVKPTDYQLTFLPSGKALRVTWTESNAKLSSHARYVVYRFRGKKPALAVNINVVAVLANTNPGYSSVQFFIDATARKGKRLTYIVTSIDRFNSESKPLAAYRVRFNKNTVKIFKPLNLN